VNEMVVVNEDDFDRRHSLFGLEHAQIIRANLMRCYDMLLLWA
jgi:hypothetical protein